MRKTKGVPFYETPCINGTSWGATIVPLDRAIMRAVN